MVLEKLKTSSGPEGVMSRSEAAVGVSSNSRGSSRTGSSGEKAPVSASMGSPAAACASSPELGAPGAGSCLLRRQLQSLLLPSDLWF